MEKMVLPTKQAKEAAVGFVRAYATTHEFFGSEEVCDAFKKRGGPDPDTGKGWRDLWGPVMRQAAQEGVITKAGKTVPRSGSTHMASTVLWRSNLYKGHASLTVTGQNYIEELRKAWVLRRVTDIRQLLWKAYEYGFDQGVAGKQKLSDDTLIDLKE